MKRILIVEDDPDILEMLNSWLSEAGYATAMAEDGMEAIDLFPQAQYDLVLLDLMLPKIDGFGACEWVRKRSNLPIVMLTALDGEAEQLRGYELKIDDYVTKPFSCPCCCTRSARFSGARAADRTKCKSCNIAI